MVSLLADAAIALGAILSMLYFGMQFFGVVPEFLLVIVVIVAGLIFLIILAYVLWPETGGSRGGSGGGVFGEEEDYDSFHRAARRINDLLRQDEEWDNIQIRPEDMDFSREEYIHKKTKDVHPHWAFLADLRASKEDVRVIYDVERDDIVHWRPNPAPLQRMDLFYGYSPVRLERMLPDRYEDEDRRRDEPDAVEVNFRARSHRAGQGQHGSERSERGGRR